jgi:hypothetical protein
VPNDCDFLVDNSSSQCEEGICDFLVDNSRSQGEEYTCSGEYIILTEGIQGPPGPGAAFYEFTQSAPSLTWTVNHNLGFYPSSTILSVGRVEMIGTVSHISVNALIISFNSPVAGFARFN